MNGVWKQPLDRLEYFLLCGFALVLPIFEMPKNLMVFLLLLVWVGGRFVVRVSGWRRPDLVEGSLLLMLAATALSTATNWPFPNGLKGFKDVFFQCFVFWIVYRARFSEHQQLRLAEMLALGVLIGIVWGIADVFQSQRAQLQFHSAGIVSQSAIYLGTAFIAALSIAWKTSESSSPVTAVRGYAALWWVASAIMIVGMFLMGSRGPLIATIIATFVLIVLAGKKRLIFYAVGLVALSVAVAAVLPDYFKQERALTKMLQLLKGNIPSADLERVSLWRIALKHVEQGESLVLGIGPRNYDSLDYKNMQFDPPLRPVPKKINHAHNLFFHKLIEEGVVGLFSLLFFFGVVIARLLRDRREDRWRRWQWFSAIGALTVPIIAGLFSDPWRQEHGLLAMLMLAMALAPVAAERKANTAGDGR